jgi:hypothetical protein
MAASSQQDVIGEALNQAAIKFAIRTFVMAGHSSRLSSAVSSTDPMSAPGHSRQFDRGQATSGLPTINGHRQTGPVGRPRLLGPLGVGHVPPCRLRPTGLDRSCSPLTAAPAVFIIFARAVAYYVVR